MFTIKVIAVGRIGSGPESELVKVYQDRLHALPCRWQIDIMEIDDRHARDAHDRRAWDADRILPALDAPGPVITLDERGKDVTSMDLSHRLQKMADENVTPRFAIGGPDGLDETVRERATLSIRFSRLTWPHKLVRAMLMEQLYRAGAIAVNHPYHRGG